MPWRDHRWRIHNCFPLFANVMTDLQIKTREITSRLITGNDKHINYQVVNVNHDSISDNASRSFSLKHFLVLYIRSDKIQAMKCSLRCFQKKAAMVGSQNTLYNRLTLGTTFEGFSSVYDWERKIPWLKELFSRLIIIIWDNWMDKITEKDHWYLAMFSVENERYVNNRAGLHLYLNQNNT